MPRSVSAVEGDVLLLDGCQSPRTSKAIAGHFLLRGVNHGRPVYERQSDSAGDEALLFFWDGRSGDRWSGWWVGPEVGWVQPAWARHDDVTALTPPSCGWRVPCQG